MQWTHSHQPITAFAWVADGAAVGYALQHVEPATRPAPNVVDATAVDAITSELHVVGQDSDRTVAVLPGMVFALEATQRELVAVPHRGPDENGRYDNPLVAVSIASGAVRTIVADPGGQGNEIALAAHEGELAFHYAKDPVPFPAFMDLGLVALSGGTPRRASDGIYLTGNILQGGSYWYTNCRPAALELPCSIAGDAHRARPHLLWPDLDGNARNLAISPDGKHLAWTLTDAYGGERLQVGDVRDGRAESSPRTMARLRLPPADLALGEMHPVSWVTDDGLRLSGLLLYPPTHRPGQRHPTVVDVHGGAQAGLGLNSGALLTTTPMEWQLWASRGYAVFMPDYRSGVISGWDAVMQARARGDFAVRDAKDVISGMRALIAAGVADRERLALIGHSAGAGTGHMVLTRTTMFRAAVLHEGLGDHYFNVGSRVTGRGDEIGEWQFEGPPWERPLAPFIRNSPSYHTGRVDTPTLLIEGGESLAKRDFSWRLQVTASRRRGVDAQYLIYEGEGHVFIKPENQKDYIERAIRWVTTHSGSGPVR